MRILVHSIFYSPDLTGVAKYTAEMCEWLAKRGHDVAVVAPPPYYPQWRIADSYRNRRYRTENLNGVRVRRAPIWLPTTAGGWRRILYSVSYAISSLPQLAREMCRRPDVVLVIEPSFLNCPGAWFFARLCGARTWLHIQDFEIDLAYGLGQLSCGRRAVSSMESWMLRRFDTVSSISEHMLQRAAAKGVKADRLMLVPNWSDPSIRPTHGTNPLRSRLGIRQDEIVVLFAGSLGAKQGLETVVEAGRALQDLRFLICGEGAVADALRTSANGLKNVTFLPLQPVEELNSLLNLADIHLLPQRRSAADSVLPSKLTGMLASGRPVIAMAEADSDIAKLLEHCGTVVPCDDQDAFIRAIRALAQEPEQRDRMGEAAREIALARFRRDDLLGRFEIELLRTRRLDAVVPSTETL